MDSREHRAAGSGRQFAAALAPTRLQDGATGSGTHPQAEPVGLRPAAVVRLEGPLAHGLAPSQSGASRVMPAVGWVDNGTADGGVVG